MTSSYEGSSVELSGFKTILSECTIPLPSPIEGGSNVQKSESGESTPPGQPAVVDRSTFFHEPLSLSFDEEVDLLQLHSSYIVQDAGEHKIEADTLGEDSSESDQEEGEAEADEGENSDEDCSTREEKSHEKEKPQKPRDPADGWICPSCTFVNPKDVAACVMCDTERSQVQLLQELKVVSQIKSCLKQPVAAQAKKEIESNVESEASGMDRVSQTEERQSSEDEESSGEGYGSQEETEGQPSFAPVTFGSIQRESLFPIDTQVDAISADAVPCAQSKRPTKVSEEEIVNSSYALDFEEGNQTSAAGIKKGTSTKAQKGFLLFAQNRKKPTSSQTPPTKEKGKEKEKGKGKGKLSAAAASPRPLSQKGTNKPPAPKAKPSQSKGTPKTKAKQGDDETWQAIVPKSRRQSSAARKAARKRTSCLPSSSSSSSDSEQSDKSAESEGEEPAPEKKKKKRVAIRKAAPKKSEEDSPPWEPIRKKGIAVPKAKLEREEEPEKKKKPSQKKEKKETQEDEEDVSDKEPSTPKAAAKKKSTKRDSLSIPNEDEGEYEWNRIQARLLADDDEATSLTAKNSSFLFRGLQFLLTGVGRNDKENQSDIQSQLEALINRQGGGILNGFQQATLASQKKRRSPYPDFPQTLVLAASSHRTLKYLLALASATPIVHYNWLIHSHEQQCLLPYSAYLLPAGSKKGKLPIYLKRPAVVFDELRVEVVGPAEWKELWRTVLKEGGAKVVQRLYTPQEYRIEYIVSEPDPSEYMKRKFKELKVPVLSSEWVIQCLLAQKLLDPTADDRFQYDYKE